MIWHTKIYGKTLATIYHNLAMKQDAVFPSEIQTLENADTVKAELVKKVKNLKSKFWKDTTYTKFVDKQTLDNAQNIVSFRSTQVVYARFVPEFQDPEIFGKFIENNLLYDVSVNSNKLSFILAGDDGQLVLYQNSKKMIKAPDYLRDFSYDGYSFMVTEFYSDIKIDKKTGEPLLEINYTLDLKDVNFDPKKVFSREEVYIELTNNIKNVF